MVDTASDPNSYSIPSNKILQNRKSFYGLRRKECETAAEWLKRMQNLIIYCAFPSTAEFLLIDWFVCGLHGDELKAIRYVDTWTLKELMEHYLDGSNVDIEPSIDESVEPDVKEFRETVPSCAELEAQNADDNFDRTRFIKVEEEMECSLENPLSDSETLHIRSVVNEDADLLEGVMKFECEDYKYPDDNPSNQPLETLKATQNDHRKKYPRTSKSVTTKRRYACYKCNKSFKDPSYLAAHREHTHLGIRSHVCEHCDKSFVCAQGLKQHAIVHSGDHPYTCDQCDKSFTQVGSLTYHKKSVHQRIRTHACSQCTKRFFLAKDLATHVLSHTGARPYACDKCDQSFTKSNNLSRHKNTVHLGIRSHKCDECEKEFTSIQSLKRHQNNTHK